MPPLYLSIHLVLTAAAAAAAWKLPARSTARRVFGWLLAVVVLGGMLVERRPEIAWESLRLAWPDLVFFSNLTLEGVAALVVAMCRSAADRSARVRATALGALALGVSLWSYAWYFAPVPGVWGTVDRAGYCRQTTDDSCSAAAAAMVLHGRGVPATEREMAEACLTRQGHGTPTLGMFRGLAVKGAVQRLRPKLVSLAGAAGLSRVPLPAILRIGLNPGAPPEIAGEMEGYGWTPGLHHSVVVLAADPKGAWLDIADPSYGRERWPTDKLEWIWDRRALILEHR
jgi:hypothetical protein